MDKFLFPSHCDCMCLPLHHVLFNLTRPAPTTPATSVGGVGNLTLVSGAIGGASGGNGGSGGDGINSGSGNSSGSGSKGGGREGGSGSGSGSATDSDRDREDQTTPPSVQTDNSTFPPRVTDGVSAEALKASGLAARVVTAAPTPSPSSRRSPALPPRTPQPRRPVVPADSLVRSHRNRNRGPAFPPTLRRHSSTNGVTRRNGRADDGMRQDSRVGELPPPLPRR